MTKEEENIIEITDEDGTVLKCELYDILELDGKQYALLLEADVAEEDAELVLMRYIEEGEDVIFETIDDDDEFNKVQEYIESYDPENENEEE